MLIYIKSIVVISLNNNKILAISTCINKDLFIILPFTKKYILKHKIKIKKKKKKSHNHNKNKPSPAKTHHKKLKTNPITFTPITTKKKKNAIGPSPLKKSKVEWKATKQAYALLVIVLYLKLKSQNSLRTIPSQNQNAARH